MASVFHTTDCRYNPQSTFWQKLNPQFPEALSSKTIFSGDLRIRRCDGSLKTRRFLLTSTHLYYLSKWNIPKLKSQINWKLFEAFAEVDDEYDLYGFKLGEAKSQLFYTRSADELEIWLEHLSPLCILSSFEEDFVVIKEIEVCNNSKILLCMDAGHSREFAVKTFTKESINKGKFVLNEIISEIKALRTCSHKNIVKLYKVYETLSHVYLIMDYFKEGDFLKRFQSSKKIPEEEILCFIKNFLETLEYIHSLGIVHRDIKLENIMMVKSSCIAEFKLIDFGFSCEFVSELNEICGSPGYVAPEILRGYSYNYKADLFSTGVLLYVLLSRRMPFHGKNIKETLEKNRLCKVRYSKSTFKGVSGEFMELMKAMLEENPSQRCSARQALQFSCFELVSEVSCLNSLSLMSADATSPDVHKVSACEGRKSDETVKFRIRKNKQSLFKSLML